MYCAGFYFGARKSSATARIAKSGHGVPCPYEESQRDRKDNEIAFAGEDHG